MPLPSSPQWVLVSPRRRLGATGSIARAGSCRRLFAAVAGASAVVAVAIAALQGLSTAAPSGAFTPLAGGRATGSLLGLEVSGFADVRTAAAFGGPRSRGRGGAAATVPAVARAAGEREAYIAVVDVEVTPGDQEAFLAASLENARNSVREEKNRRFDVLQSRDDASRFVLVEIYADAQGPVEHKATEHYAAWRDSVADIMASPRKATQWDTVFPEKVDGFEPKALILEREVRDVFDITHVFVDVVPGSEEAFIESTVACMKEACQSETGIMRSDVLRSVEDPTKFLLIQVYRRPEQGMQHMRTDHFARWRSEVASMMAEPREFKKYVNHFPNLFAGWQMTM